MNIPDKCDLCGSSVKEGDYGQSWWICTNKTCKKSNPNWSFEEAFNSHRDRFKKLEEKINVLKIYNLPEGSFTIDPYTARWIGDGSGKILVDGIDNNVRYYIENGVVVYQTSDEKLVHIFKIYEFDERIKEVWGLLQEQLSIFD